MKKIILFLLIILISGCGVKEKEVIKEEVTPVINEYVDDNPITVSLYQNGTLKKLKEFNSKWIAMKDINVFTAAFTNDEQLSEYYYQDVWNHYYKNYSNIDDYKIGYYIGFYLKDGSYRGECVLNPSQMNDFLPYLYLYLYDDVNQKKGSWYIHIEQDEVKENSLFTSLKIMAGDNINEISSPITLSVFTYNGDEDFKDGKYRGKSSYTILINNTK